MPTCFGVDDGVVDVGDVDGDGVGVVGVVVDNMLMGVVASWCCWWC